MSVGSWGSGWCLRTHGPEEVTCWWEGFTALVLASAIYQVFIAYLPAFLKQYLCEAQANLDPDSIEAGIGAVCTVGASQ